MKARILCISLLILGALAATIQPSAARSSETQNAPALALNTFVQQTKLTASDGAAGDHFGFSISISDDGNTAAIGVYQDDIGGNVNQGSVYVFVRSGGAWSFQQKLTASDGAYVDEFGYAVALSGNGEMLVVGARRADVASADDDRGAAYVFIRDGTTWSQWQKLTATGGVDYDYFGSAAAMSRDGSTLAIGADAHNIGASGDQGAVFVFYRGLFSLFWSQQQKLTAAGGEAGDHFGYSVALGSDGSTLVAGAYKDRVGGNAEQGSAYVFVRDWLGAWSPQQQLTASDGAANERFGNAVTLSGDGNTVVVGAYWDSTGSTSTHGSAYVFTRSGITWSQQQKLTAAEGAANDEFGFAVALSRDGNTLVSGAQRADVVSVGDDRGAAYVFARIGGTWTQQQKLTDADAGYYDYFGSAVAVNANGSTVLVGVDSDNVGSSGDQGAVVVFATHRLYLPIILKGN